MQCILIGYALFKYKAILLECKHLEKYLEGYGQTLGELKELSTDDFQTWDNSDGIVYDRYAYLGLDKCVDSEKDLWLDLGKAMWRKHRSVNEDHMKYIRNDIVKPFHVVILCYTERVQDTHDLEKHLTPPEMKSNFYEADSWKVCYKYFYVDDIQV